MNKVETKTTQIPLNYGNYSEQPFMELIVGSSCHVSRLSFQIKLLPHMKLWSINCVSLTQIKGFHF